MAAKLEFKTIVLKSKTVAGLSLTLEWIGEGLSGDYDPADSKDAPMLRFTVAKSGEDVENGSYCTSLDARAPRAVLHKAGAQLLAIAESCEGNYKHAMAQASWICATQDRHMDASCV